MAVPQLALLAGSTGGGGAREALQPWKVAPGERYVARRTLMRPEPLKRECVGVPVYRAGGGRRNAEICEPLRDRAARRCTLTGCAPP